MFRKHRPLTSSSAVIRPVYEESGALIEASAAQLSSSSATAPTTRCKVPVDPLMLTQAMLVHLRDSLDGSLPQRLLHVLQLLQRTCTSRRKRTDPTLSIDGAAAVEHDAPEKKKRLRDEAESLLTEVDEGLKRTLLTDSTASSSKRVELLLPRLHLLPCRDGKPIPGESPVNVSTYQAVTVFGRDRSFCDVLVEHPSCSMQHAAAMVVLSPPEQGDVEKEHAHYNRNRDEDDDAADDWDVEVQLVDLGSTNGTFVNGNRLEPLERTTLLEGDVIQFGHSTRRYIAFKQQKKK